MRDTEVDVIICPLCAGTGEGAADGARCWACKGTGSKIVALESDDDEGDWWEKDDDF